MSDADIDRLGDSLWRNVAAQAAQAAQVSQPQPVHWMVKVEADQRKIPPRLQNAKTGSTSYARGELYISKYNQHYTLQYNPTFVKIRSLCTFLHYNPDQNYEEEIISFHAFCWHFLLILQN